MTQDRSQPTVSATAGRLTRGRLLARNTLFNLIGQGLPMVVALFAIPLLIRGLGTDRFGVLTLAWMVIGYFSLFDLGLGRAMTQLVAKKLGEERTNDIPPFMWTALFMMTVMGGVGTLVLSSLSPWLVQSVLKVPKELQAETVKVFYTLALSLPLVISVSGLRGFLEAHQRFDLINIINVVMGAYTFLAPLAVLPFSHHLLPIVMMLLIGRGIACLTYFCLCLRLFPSLRRQIVVKWPLLLPLFSFGGWMTVTNIIGPLMTYLDRFLIGGFISMSAVAFYATPYEVATKLWLIPRATVAVLFPAFSTSFQQNPSQTAELFQRSVKYLFMVMFPLVLTIITLAPEMLHLWLGPEFAAKSTVVLQLLVAGVFLNGLCFIPLSMIQGMGRPDITAKLHLVELPFYLLAIWWFIITFGIEGAALAWTLRVAIDGAILFYLVYRALPAGRPFVRRLIWIMAMAALGLTLAAWQFQLALKVLIWGMTSLIFVLAAWKMILSPWERAHVQTYLRKPLVLFTKG